MGGKRVLATAVALLSAVAGTATAGDREIQVRVGAALNGSLLDTIYVTRHSPAFDGARSTAATQSLPLDTGWGPGVELAVEIPFGDGFGLQLLADQVEANIAAPAGSYRTQLSYVSFPPPNNVPIDIDRDDTMAWPAASGRAQTLALAANLAWSREVRDQLRLGVSGGLALLRTSGRAESLGHSAFRLGGHSVLFGGVTESEFEYGPTTGVGVDAGAFVDLAFGERLSVRADARFFAAGEREAPVTLSRVLNADEVFIGSTDLASVQSELSPQPLTVDPSFFRAAVTLGWRF